MSQLLLLLGLIPAQADILETFEFQNDVHAHTAWTVSEGTPPVKRHVDKAGHALQVDVPLTTNPKLRRAVVDRAINLNLSAPTSFTLELSTAHLRLVDRASLYFHSKDGWFSGSARLSQEHQQTLRFDKSDFRNEDEPAGWHDIDRIRIAFWKSTDEDVQPRDTSVLLHKLTSSWNNTAIVLPDSATGEWKSTHASADTIEKMLSESGVAVDRLPESSLQHGSIGKRSLLLLPYNRPTADVCGVLKTFVERGGKLFLTYSVPRPLQDVLGFERGAYYKPADSDAKLATIRFDDNTVSGLPSSTKQASWNIATAEPIGHGARVIGWWYDANGKPTNKSALLLSDRAAYLSHIVLPDDWDNKKQMLAAILGQLDPKLWQEIVATGFARAERVGHCRSGAELAKALTRSPVPDAQQSLRAADAALAESHKLLADGRGYEASEAVQRCRVLRAEAYLQAQPSPTREARAFWEHAGTGAYPGDWDRTCKELADAGFNMIIPNMLWAGAAHYPSDVLPRSKTFEKHGDQIAQCLAAAKQYGLEVHVWKVNHNPGRYAPQEFLDRMRRAGRTQVDVHGTATDWLNPAHPENLKLELESMLEVVRKYDVDGIHFDYIRYPNSDLDYSDFSRHKFEADTKLKVKEWPADCYSGPLRGAYRDWRAAQITRLVEAVSREARKIRPGVKISAAVFRDYPSCRDSVGQDWPLWAKKGYVDFLCPMDYTGDDEQFTRWITSQKKLVGDVPLYPGIGAASSRVTLPVDRVVGQIHITRTLGADGFTIFNLNERTAKSLLPGIRAGAGRNPAKPRH